jgi:cysteinyl-tRNA synthetase, unknown class
LRGLFKRLLLMALLIGPVVALSQFPRPRPVLTARQGPAIADVKSWGYQLQRVVPRLLPANIDMMVVDYSRTGTDGRAWTADEVEAMRRRPDGSKRIVLAYMSVGEAENYRFYWWPHWVTVPPAWMAPENPQWPGNFPVRFWHSSWMRNIVDPAPSTLERLVETRINWRKPYLDRIIEAGFDGVYLDRVDVYEQWLNERPTALDDMVTFVSTISRHAKMRRSGFLIVPQNAEELLNVQRYRDAIDAIAKEDMFYGLGGNGVKNPEAEVTSTRALLDRLRTDKRPAFVVEYLDDAARRTDVQRRAASMGYVVHFATRGLNKAPQPVQPLPADEPLLQPKPP